MGRWKELMAEHSENCRVCRFARENPEHWFGALVAWHGKFCPFWRAREEIHGQGAKR